MHLSKLASGLALIGLVAFSPAHGQQQAGNESLGDKDQQFMNYAAEDNQAEIQLCLLAEKRATNPALKAFARLMVDDDVAIESRLAALANELHADLPNGIGKEGQETRSKLAPLTGNGFENAFMKAQIKDHSGDIQKFSDEAQSTQNTRIEQFAKDSDHSAAFGIGARSWDAARNFGWTIQTKVGPLRTMCEHCSCNRGVGIYRPRLGLDWSS